MYATTPGEPPPCVACGDFPQTELSPGDRCSGLCATCLTEPIEKVMALLLLRVRELEYRSLRLLERLRGRACLNARTAILHPDERARVECKIRMKALQSALADAEQIMKEELPKCST